MMAIMTIKTSNGNGKNVNVMKMIMICFYTMVIGTIEKIGNGIGGVPITIWVWVTDYNFVMAKMYGVEVPKV